METISTQDYEIVSKNSKGKILSKLGKRNNHFEFTELVHKALKNYSALILLKVKLKFYKMFSNYEITLLYKITVDKISRNPKLE